MLNDADRATYEWQLDVPGFGEAGQVKLRDSAALVSRVGGLGGSLAMSLAAAGFGKIVLVHGGDLREDDLNRQTLMARDWIGRPRADCAAETLRRFKPEEHQDEKAEDAGSLGAYLTGVFIDQVRRWNVFSVEKLVHTEQFLRVV